MSVIVAARSDRHHVTDEAILTGTAVAFALGLLAHNGVHALRGLAEVPDAVVWAGTFVLMAVASAFTLVATRHPLAPTVAAVVGSATALGVVAVHVLPAWGPVSDPLITHDVGVGTWLAVVAEIAGASLFAAGGLVVLRRRRAQSVVGNDG